MLAWIKKLFASASQQRMIERTCPKCGKTFSLPEDVQYWPDYCRECRAEREGKKRRQKIKM